jgi:CRP-like cAMP-binding protein
MFIQQLDQTKLFNGLSPLQQAAAGQLFDSINLEARALIFEQGDPAEYLYIVIEGEVMIQYKPDDGPLLTIARVKPEGVVGWSAVLGNPLYTSAAVCASAARLLRSRGEDLRRFCERDPETASLLLERLAASDRRLPGAHSQLMALLKKGMQNGKKKPAAENY